MKNIAKRFFAFLLSLMLVLGLSSIQAFALSPDVDAGVASQVNQSGDASTFAYNMPFATYRVYPSYLRVGGEYQKEFVSKDNRIKQRDYYNNASAAGINNKASSVVFEGEIKSGGKVDLKGEVFHITYRNAAIDSAGKSHNVTLTVSDVTIQNFSGKSTGSTEKTAKSVTIMSGAVQACAIMFDKLFTEAEVTAGQSQETVQSHYFSQCAVSMTVTMTIDGADDSGSLNISFTDLDTGTRDTKDKANDPKTYDGQYSERVEINSGYIKSKAYITRAAGDPKNLLNVSRGKDGLLFRGTQITNTTEETYYSGFAIQVTPTNVIKWTGGTCATGLYGGTSTIAIRPLTKLYDNTNSKISDTWTVSDKGGSISMTESYDKSTISYSDETVKYGANKYVARFYTNQKPTTFTAGANEGYELVGMNYSTKNGSADPTDGAVTLDAKKQWTHTLESGNGAHYAAGFYQPVVKTLYVEKVDQDGNPIKGVTFTIEGESSIHGEFCVSGVTDENGNASIANVPYGKDTDKYTLTETVPDGYRLPDGAVNPIEFKYSDLGTSTDGIDFTVNNQQIFTVSYSVAKDEEYGTPEGVSVPVDNNTYDKGTDVSLKSGLSSSQNYAINKTGETIPGTWSFEPAEGWSLTEGSYDNGVTQITGIAKNEIVYGKWTFTPYEYTVTYDWGDTAPTEGLVENPPVLPVDPENYDWHEYPSIDENYDDTTEIRGKDESGAPGTWSFSGWTVSEELTEDGIEGNVIVTGAWTFTPDTYSVRYDWTGDIPEEVELPEGGECYDWHYPLEADPEYNETTEIIGKKDGVPGKYVFSGWTPSDELTANGIEGNVVFTGEWTFIPDTYIVEYELTGDPKWSFPKDASEAPVDGKTYKYNEEVNVAANLTTMENYAIDPDTGEKVSGKWTFTPWDKENFKITGNTVIKGFWTFTPDVPADTPKTGDPINPTLCAVLLFASAAGIVTTTIIGKKKKLNNR